MLQDTHSLPALPRLVCWYIFDLQEFLLNEVDSDYLSDSTKAQVELCEIRCTLNIHILCAKEHICQNFDEIENLVSVFLYSRILVKCSGKGHFILVCIHLVDGYIESCSFDYFRVFPYQQAYNFFSYPGQVNIVPWISTSVSLLIYMDIEMLIALLRIRTLQMIFFTCKKFSSFSMQVQYNSTTQTVTQSCSISIHSSGFEKCSLYIYAMLDHWIISIQYKFVRS